MAFFCTVQYNGKWALGNGAPGNGVWRTLMALGFLNWKCKGTFEFCMLYRLINSKDG